MGRVKQPARHIITHFRKGS